MALYHLTPQDQTNVRAADPSAIQNALGILKNRGVPPWLSPTNPYQSGSIPRNGVGTAQDKIEVLAISGPLHAMDGWGYVSQSLNALISGNIHAARHLAYYGELRAALSILASSGIGICNRNNFSIDSLGNILSLKTTGTHQMCWATIQEWAQSQTNNERVLNSFDLNGTSLLVPVQEFFPGGARFSASDILAGWGFDLARGSEDHDERNWSSYQPTALSILRTTPAEDKDFLKLFWEALRPSGFALERHLLRIFLEKQAVLFRNPLSSYIACHSRLDDGLRSLVSFEFLTRAVEGIDHEFLRMAGDTTTPARPYSMICRAALLLRLATGMAENNFHAAGLRPETHFNAWWKELGETHALWATGSEPEESSQLWDDIDLALEDVERAPTAHRHEWISTLSGSAMRICETERAGLWGLFP